MATKDLTAKHRDFVTTIQDALDQEKIGDPLARVRSLPDQRRGRAEKRIATLEAERKAVNARIDQAIAREQAVIKDLEQQSKRIRIPDNILKKADPGTIKKVRPGTAKARKAGATKRRVPKKP